MRGHPGDEQKHPARWTGSTIGAAATSAAPIPCIAGAGAVSVDSGAAARNPHPFAGPKSVPGAGPKTAAPAASWDTKDETIIDVVATNGAAAAAEAAVIGGTLNGAASSCVPVDAAEIGNDKPTESAASIPSPSPSPSPAHDAPSAVAASIAGPAPAPPVPGPPAPPAGPSGPAEPAEPAAADKAPPLPPTSTADPARSTAASSALPPAASTLRRSAEVEGAQAEGAEAEGEVSTDRPIAGAAVATVGVELGAATAGGNAGC